MISPRRTHPPDDDRTGLAASLGRLTDGLSRLVSEHLALARAELRADARGVGGQVAKVAVFLPLVLVGYGFVCAAVAVGLAELLPLWAALLAVGAVNLFVGAAGAWAAASRLRAQPGVLEHSLAEAQRSAAALSLAARIPPAEAGNGRAQPEQRLGG